MGMEARLFDWRCRRAEALLARRSRRRLAAELAEFSGTHGRDDLLALLERYDDDQTAEVRAILDVQDLTRRQHARLAGCGFRTA